MDTSKLGLPDIFKKNRGHPPCRLVLFVRIRTLQIFFIFEKWGQSSEKQSRWSAFPKLCTLSTKIESLLDYFEVLCCQIFKMTVSVPWFKSLRNTDIIHIYIESNIISWNSFILHLFEINIRISYMIMNIRCNILWRNVISSTKYDILWMLFTICLFLW